MKFKVGNPVRWLVRKLDNSIVSGTQVSEQAGVRPRKTPVN